eukprot:CAMPEP_0174337440 /NCGR_PEP_ID=MMETSP0810-20121108/22315_1 /TAXON_ID=73025 ORGANISM="Eutreptiella gymnastica-like, Strain CCMP1594" /NCGR_SAMPLE_ID=MMETSP0810 /ASSEMBLY_ACC=CAM_ASM_000659 /LENGTH=47 /DNA_ID= /DNA_START= /DNA_END= /DNA_ORIENTATION=
MSMHMGTQIGDNKEMGGAITNNIRTRVRAILAALQHLLSGPGLGVKA